MVVLFTYFFVLCTSSFVLRGLSLSFEPFLSLLLATCISIGFVYSTPQFQSFWHRRNFLRQLVFPLGLLVFLCPLLVGVDALVEFLVGFPAEKQYISTVLTGLQGDSCALAFAVIGTVVCAPLFEEVVFRGYFQSYLTRKIGPRFAVGAVSFLFALLHCSPAAGLSHAALFCHIFLLAVVLGLLMHFYHSLIAPVVLHAAFNGLSLLFIMQGKM